MNIIIIEDEVKTARSLEQTITELEPGNKVIGRYKTVKSSVTALLTEPMPDLIFMDIQLEDALCFEIFKSVKITCPVVFCTAYEEYSQEAFRNNGVDYVLKPFSKERIQLALNKVDGLRNFFQRNITPVWEDVISKFAPATRFKSSFLIFINQKYKTVHVDDIAFFFSKHETTWIGCFNKLQFQIDQSLDHIATAVSPTQFFRINRQYLVNFKAIKEVEPHFLRKLFVRLTIEAPDKLLVNKDKSHSFLDWMEKR